MIDELKTETGPLGEAVFSSCDKYRYLLQRPISKSERILTWIMLNPSTATSLVNDPTVAKCVGYGQRWGYGLVEVVNIFALRSTDPNGLKAFSDPIGPVNNEFIINCVRNSEKVMCAWGRHGDYLGRGRAVAKMLKEKNLDHKLYYLEVSKKDYAPHHPLYKKNSLEPQPWTADKYISYEK